MKAKDKKLSKEEAKCAKTIRFQLRLLTEDLTPDLAEVIRAGDTKHIRSKAKALHENIQNARAESATARPTREFCQRICDLATETNQLLCEEVGDGSHD